MKKALQPSPAPAQEPHGDVHVADPIAQLREKPWLTAEEAACYLGKTVTALYKFVRRHRVPYGRVGREYRFDPRALDRWIDAKGLTVREPWTTGVFRTGTRG